jgi:hypothetical protein
MDIRLTPWVLTPVRSASISTSATAWAQPSSTPEAVKTFLQYAQSTSGEKILILDPTLLSSFAAICWDKDTILPPPVSKTENRIKI